MSQSKYLNSMNSQSSLLIQRPWVTSKDKIVNYVHGRNTGMTFSSWRKTINPSLMLKTQELAKMISHEETSNKSSQRHSPIATWFKSRRATQQALSQATVPKNKRRKRNETDFLQEYTQAEVLDEQMKKMRDEIEQMKKMMIAKDLKIQQLKQQRMGSSQQTNGYE